MTDQADPRTWLRHIAIVLLVGSYLFVMPASAQSSLICDAGVGKSLINSLTQLAYGSYGVITILAIIGDRFVQSAPFLDQSTKKKFMQWRGKVIGGAILIYVVLPIGYQVALNSGVPLPTCIDLIPL